MNEIIFCTRRIEFDAGHRLINHESKCKNLHGHRYVLEISFSGKKLDNVGRVIDFGVIKDIVKDWIDNNWDHNTILSLDDSKLGSSIEKTTGQKIYYMPYNPTAENMAKYLFSEILPNLFIHLDVQIEKLRIFETPTCYVDIFQGNGEYKFNL